MILRVDNNDGAGELDYTPAVRSDAPLTIVRARGEWTVCQAGLALLGTGLPSPGSRSRVRVLDASGAVLFAGFVLSAALPTEAVAAASGADDCVLLRAVETAWIAGGVPPDALQPVTAAQHTVALSDVSLAVERVRSPTADSAQDVTLSGEQEATAYVTELFRGDGSTQSFVLQHSPFRESGNGTLLDDAFDGSALDADVWSRLDTGSHLALGAGGLRMSGGTGFDGATVLSWRTSVEMGGSLIAEASNVMLTPGSDGILLGFYDGTVARAQCTAGLRVEGSDGAQAMVAVVNGAEQATRYNFADGHSYTLRVRLYCPEMQRVRARYGVLVDGVVQQFGGDAVDAPMRVVMEAVDTGLASNTLPTVLYDGAMAVSPLKCVFAPVNSVQLNGSIGRVSLEQMGSCLVTLTLSDGTRRTCREGASGSGADFTLSSSMLTFQTGVLPGPGDLVTVVYRRGGRAVSRRVDDTAAFLEGVLGLPGVPAWSGRVLSPAARSSADCDAAAKALLALADGAATAIEGSAKWTRNGATADDVQPGDTVRVQSAEGTQILPVQSVKVVDGNCDPESVEYTVVFRQDRVASMDFRVESGLSEDVTVTVAVAVDEALPVSLSGLQVTVVTAASLQVDSGVDAADGSGFEVRKSDANFGSSDAADLVLRSPVRSFAIPRASFAERFFVRMYDNSEPSKYSAVSSIVLTHLPTS